MEETTRNDPGYHTRNMQNKEAMEFVESVPTDRNPNGHVADHDADHGNFKFTIGKLLAILSFQLGYFSDTLVISLSSAVLVPIDHDLGPAKSYVWIATANLVAGAAFAPIVGRFGDIFGRRNILLIGNLLGIVGCAVSATGKDINTLIAGGVLIGTASSMRQVAWACLGEIVPKKSRGMAFGLFQASLAPASAFAPLIAFALIENGSWRPIYWIPLALDVASLVLVFLFYHPMNQYIHEEGKTVWHQFLHTDWIGSLLFMGGLTVFLMGISFGGNEYPWASAGTIVPTVVGCLAMVALGFYEAYAKIKYPIFPPTIFSKFRDFTVIQFGIFLVGMLFYSTAILWPLQVQTLYATDNTKIGLYSSAAGLGGLSFAMLFGLASKKLPHLKWQLVASMAGMTLFSGLQAIVTPTSNVASTCMVILVFAFVAGTNVISTAMIQLSVSHEFIGIASGMIVCSRTTGGAVGATIYATILRNRVTALLPKYVAAPLAVGGVPLASIPAVIEALTTGAVTSPALTSLKPAVLYAAVEGLKQTYAHSFKLVYLISIAFGVAGVVVLCFAGNMDQMKTSKIDIKLQEGAHIHVNTDTGEGHIVRAEVSSK